MRRRTCKLAFWCTLLLLATPSICLAGLLDFRKSADDAILPADQAFMVHAPLWDGKEMILGFAIAPGCYLYRDRITVEATRPAGYELGFASMPLGEAFADRHFGRTTIYRDSMQIRFRPKSGQPPTRIKVRYQGCAEGMVCYPWQTRLLSVITR